MIPRRLVEKVISELTPGEIGIISSTLDGLKDFSDDWSVEELTSIIQGEYMTYNPEMAQWMAYHIVHDRGRTI